MDGTREDPSTSKGGRGERTRVRILEAALCVLAERGAGSLTYRAVAEEAGVSLGVTSYHFASRGDLLSGAFKLHLDQVRERGEAFEAESGSDSGDAPGSLDELTDRLVDFVATMIRDDRESVVASRELSLELIRNPELVRDVEATLAAHHRVTADLLSRVTDTAPDADAAIVAAVMDELALGWIARPGDAEYAERVRRVLRRLAEKFLTGET